MPRYRRVLHLGCQINRRLCLRVREPLAVARPCQCRLLFADGLLLCLLAAHRPVHLSGPIARHRPTVQVPPLTGPPCHILFYLSGRRGNFYNVTICRICKKIWLKGVGACGEHRYHAHRQLRQPGHGTRPRLRHEHRRRGLNAMESVMDTSSGHSIHLEGLPPPPPHKPPPPATPPVATPSIAASQSGRLAQAHLASPLIRWQQASR